nr:DUF1398 family protein [Micromonospora sp. DSM 115978]
TVHCTVPANAMLYASSAGAVVQLGPAVIEAAQRVPDWDEPAMVAAIRADQAGRSSFPEFLAACWQAGVTDYEVDLRARTCTYHGLVAGDQYVEAYPAVTVRS